MIDYRMLQPSEWDKIEAPFKRAFGEHTLPPPEVAMCAIAELEDGSIGGFLFCQPLVHVEPGAVSHPDVSINRLRLLIESHLAQFDGMEYFSYTSDERFDAAMIAAGYEPVGVLWRKRVGVDGC